MSHHHREMGGDWEDVYALLSDDPATDTAVIFVHGFKGHPRLTWLDFQGLVDTGGQRPSWSKTDLYFYAYPSVSVRLGPNEYRLRRFISAVFPNPDPHLFNLTPKALYFGLELDVPPISIRESPIHYRQLVLVGHSEGGVVLRAAIKYVVTLFDQSSKDFEDRWMYGTMEAKLCLFAPALMGASLSGWKGALLYGLPSLGRIGAAIRALVQASPAYGELQPNSMVLAGLQNSTEDYWRRYREEISALRARICWGEKEEILAVGQYQHDQPVYYETNQDHVSVCKPSGQYTRPLEFVSE